MNDLTVTFKGYAAGTLLALDLSGAVAGVKQRFDIFGVLVLSFAAASAGGIMRALCPTRKELACDRTQMRTAINEASDNPDYNGLGLYTKIGAGTQISEAMISWLSDSWTRVGLHGLANSAQGAVRPVPLVGYLVCAAGFLLCVVAYYPGYVSPDTIRQLTEGRAWRFTDWHPPLMATV